MRHMLSLAALLLIGAAPAAMNAQAPALAELQPGQGAADLSAVQAFADAAVREGKVPGIAIAIGQGDGPTRFVVAGRTGFAASDPTVTPDTLWRIYSMTKPVSGLAAMILIDEGKLRLDQPLAEIFPEFAVMRVLTDPAHGTETRPASAPITIRELMTHTSGLNYAILADTPARKQLADDGITPFEANAAIEAKVRPKRPASLQAFAQRTAKAPLVADPGTRWSYSMGLDIVAAVVERVSGMPFDRFVQRRILTPLNLNSTGWQVPRAQAARFASSYAPTQLATAMWPGMTSPATSTLVLVDPAKTSVYLQKPSFPYGGAGLVSSARDYDRFLHLLENGGTLDGVRILSARTAALARSNLLPPDLALSGSGPIPAGERFGFGAGGFVTLDAKDGFGRSRGTFGWDGAAGSRGWTDPVRRLRVTMMINVFGSSALGNDLDKIIAGF
jgi:CubicO group peptidase (beta-lactamase class C family)